MRRRIDDYFPFGEPENLRPISPRECNSRKLSSLAEIKHYLDLYGTHGEGRTVQMKYVLDRTSKAIAELEQKRAHIDASLAELRIINASVKRGLGK